MDDNHRETRAEEAYLSQTISQIERLLTKAMEKNRDNEQDILAAQQEMWDHSELFSDNSFERLLAMSQLSDPIGMQISSYEFTANKITTLKKMSTNPYFARIDFTEAGAETEKIYIGRTTVMNDENFDIYVYDWRAPIAGIFYRFEPGAVYYEAPMGRIDGIVSLKRQYEIKEGKLQSFFDVNIHIEDAFLRKILSENRSSTMKAIVETIQRNQDQIIRDMENDLLIVQGVAGSGKTSVALHRIAYLMYEGLSSKLNATEMVIVSPNPCFSQYIADVLPDLGETNVTSLGFEDLCKKCLPAVFADVSLQTRNQFFEELITCDDSEKKKIMKSSMEFKASKVFITMLNRFIERFEERMIAFEDIYYDGQCVFDVQLLRDFISRRGEKTSLQTMLKNLEKVIFEKIRELRKPRMVKLEEQVREQGDHALEVAAYARLLSIRESTELLNVVRRFTEIDFGKIYRKMFADKILFDELADGLSLPEQIEEIRQYTFVKMAGSELLYEDGLALLYLKAKLTEMADYHHIKHVVVDEAQDYYSLHFELLRLLFVKAKYTILGDINQTIEKETDLSIYEDMVSRLERKKSAVMFLSKSFRCTSEILSFGETFIENKLELESFNRHGEVPNVIRLNHPEELEEMLITEIKTSKELGYQSIGILCRSDKDAKELYDRIKDRIVVKRITETNISEITDVFILPIYLAKGLEFDAALIYGMKLNSRDEAEKKLLYIASTRALHRLTFFDANMTKEDSNGI